MESLAQDIRYAWRTFRANRTATLVAVLVLALGVGATTAIYSVVEGVLLRPLPYRQPERVVAIMQVPRERLASNLRIGESPRVAGLRALRARSHWFEELSGASGALPLLTGLGDAARIRAWDVESNLFPMLGVQPILGRGFTRDEDAPESAPVIVLSYDFWSTRFARDSTVLGRSITLDGTAYRIVGVMPAGFRFPVLSAATYYTNSTAVWRSIGSQGTPADRDSRWVVGRLRPGATLAQARGDVGAVLTELGKQTPRFANRVPLIVPVQELVVADARRPLLLVLGAVGFVLLIACANVANLLLARAAARRREIAIRGALGASRLRIVRQLLTEAVMLALAGAAVGVLLAAWGVPVLVSLAGTELPRLQEVGINMHVLRITGGVALLTALLFGLAPTLHAVRRTSASALKEGSAGSGMGAAPARASGAFIIVQMALTLVLLVGAGLLGRSFINLVTLDPGFDAAHTLVAKTILGEQYRVGASMRTFARTAVERAEALPGVTAAAVSTGVPLAGVLRGSITVAGQPTDAAGPQGDVIGVTPGYFRTLGIPLHSGRLLQTQDEGGEQQVVINEAVVQALFPGENPIGKRISFFNGVHPGTVVGVVANTRGISLLAPPPPVVYELLADDQQYFMNVIVRTSGDPAALAAPLRAALRDIDPTLPVTSLETMPQTVAESITAQRFYATLLGVFSAIALCMAAAGLYALVSYAVVRRTRELGIRMALGAVPRDVLQLVVGRGVVLALTGIAFGIAGAFAATRVLRSYLFEIGPTDPLVFAGVAAGLAGVALAASWLPARRATRIDPVAVLRDE